MDFLAEPPSWAYWLLIVAAAVPLLAAFFLPLPQQAKKSSGEKKISRRTLLFAASALAVLLFVGLKVADRYLESDREQIERKLKDMSAGVRERNLNKVFDHVAESFRYGTSTKAQLRTVAQQAQERGQVTEMPIWDINVDPIASGANNATVVFRVKVIGNALHENQFLCRATFVRDSDRQWRLQGFEVFPPTGLKDAIPVPGL